MLLMNELTIMPMDYCSTITKLPSNPYCIHNLCKSIRSIAVTQSVTLLRKTINEDKLELIHQYTLDNLHAVHV